MTFMAQPLPLPRGFRTWTCACGRLGLALAVERCPDCGGPQPGAAPAPPAETAAPAPPARKRTRTRKE